MQRETKLVSIVIPAYNAEAFIEETIQSIKAQTYSNWEIIVVNDGSKDRTAAIVQTMNSDRIRLVSQQNAGVAAARNNGLTYTKGEWVVFFDADDLMTPQFLESRVEAIENEPGVGYVGGTVETFPIAMTTRQAAASDPVNEILFSSAAFVTVPSNYLFEKKILTDNNIVFNSKLSSSADRFFILEVSKFTRGKNLSGETGKLLYRYTSQSMSHKVTPGLIIDNERFYYELKKKHLLPSGKIQLFKSFYFMSLAKGFGIVRYWKMVIKYLAMSFVNHPVFFTKNLGKTVFRMSATGKLDRAA